MHIEVIKYADPLIRQNVDPSRQWIYEIIFCVSIAQINSRWVTVYWKQICDTTPAEPQNRLEEVETSDNSWDPNT